VGGVGLLLVASAGVPVLDEQAGEGGRSEGHGEQVRGGASVVAGGQVDQLPGRAPELRGLGVVGLDAGAGGAGQGLVCGAELGGHLGRGLLDEHGEALVEGRDVRLGDRAVVPGARFRVALVGQERGDEVAVEGVGVREQRVVGAGPARGRVLLRGGVGGEAGLDGGPGQVGGELAGREPHGPAGGVDVAGPVDAVADDLAVLADGVDTDAEAALQKVEELLRCAGAGEGFADLLLQPHPRRFRPAVGGGLVDFRAGGAAGGGLVAGLQAAQPEFGLQLAALGLGALAVLVPTRSAAVLADRGGDDVDVAGVVPHGDPPAGHRVAGGGDAGGVDDPPGDHRPFGVREQPVLGGDRDGAVPHVAVLPLDALGLQAVHGDVEEAGELGEGDVRVAAGVGDASVEPGGDDVRVVVLVATTGPVEVAEQAAGVAAELGLDVGDHLTPPGRRPRGGC
jgi:hypothetical protein